jgi:tight adherence protein B
LSIGEGRAAYASDMGQAAVILGMVMIGACWLWAARLMKLPEEERVFFEAETARNRRAAQVRR